MADKKYLREVIDGIINKKTEGLEEAYRNFIIPKSQEILGIIKEEIKEDNESCETDEEDSVSDSDKFLKNRDKKTDKSKVKKMKVEDNL